MEKDELAESEEQLKKDDLLARRLFDPNMSYNSNELVVRTHNLLKTIDYANAIHKKEGRPNASMVNDLIVPLIGNRANRAIAEKLATKMDEMSVRAIARKARRELPANAAAFVRKNLNQCMDAIEDSSELAGPLLEELIIGKGRVYKIRGDSEHNEVYERVMTKFELDKAVQEFQQGKRAKLDKILQKDVNENEHLSEWGKELLNNYLWDPAVQELALMSKAKRVNTLAALTIRKKDGEYDVRKSKNIVKRSYEEGWRLHDDEEDRGRKNDMRKYALNPFGLDILSATEKAERPGYIEDVKSYYGDDYDDMQERAEDREFAGVGRTLDPEEEVYGTKV